MRDPKKRRKHVPLPADPIEPSAPKRSEQVPVGDDSDINEGRELDLEKDGDREIASSDPDDGRAAGT